MTDNPLTPDDDFYAPAMMEGFGDFNISADSADKLKNNGNPTDKLNRHAVSILTDEQLDQLIERVESLPGEDILTNKAWHLKVLAQAREANTLRAQVAELESRRFLDDHERAAIQNDTIAEITVQVGEALDVAHGDGDDISEMIKAKLAEKDQEIERLKNRRDEETKRRLDAKVDIWKWLKTHCDEEITNKGAVYKPKKGYLQSDWVEELVMSLQAQIGALVEALEFYNRKDGDPRLHFDVLWLDKGERARNALASLPQAAKQYRARVENSRRYERIRLLGCAPAGTKQLDKGTVLRFQSLDMFLDADLKAHPSRGEYKANSDGKGE